MPAGIPDARHDAACRGGGFGEGGVNGSFANYGSYQNIHGEPPLATYALSFVEAVAFDPTGSGRKDHIAYIGFEPNDERIILYVQDADTGESWQGYWFPTDASWIKKSNPENWRATILPSLLATMTATARTIWWRSPISWMQAVTNKTSIANTTSP